MPCSLRQSSVSLNCLKASAGTKRRARRKRLEAVNTKTPRDLYAGSSQKRLIVVAGLGGCTGRRVVAFLLAYALELVELCLLVVGEMGQMAGRVLERLDAGEVCHGDLGLWLVRKA